MHRKDIFIYQTGICLILLFLLWFFPAYAQRSVGPAVNNPICTAYDDEGSAPIEETRPLVDTESISFVENRGQIVDMDGNLCPDILYSADAGAARLYFTQRGVSYVFQRAEEGSADIERSAGDKMTSAHRSDISSASEFSYYRMDMLLVGSNSDVRIRAEQELPGYDNYYYAHCPQGITHVRSFGRIVYENVYDRIDMVFAASADRTKYEFIVHPGGDASRIRLRYDGAVTITQSESGGLAIATPIGKIGEQSPYSYQYGAKEIPSAFVLEGSEISFEIGAFDTTQPLVIDPWATYYGGSGSEAGWGIATDASGNVIVGGWTNSVDFPVQGGYQGTSAGNSDVFVVKFSSTGTRQWATYYGGSHNEAGYNLTTDGAGNIVVAGPVASIDFPVLNAAQSTIGAYGADDLFVFKLNPDGTRQWATYYGGSERETCGGVACDGNGNVIVSGGTTSSNFPVVNAYQSSANGQRDAIVVKFSSTGSVQWATYFGGNRDETSESVAVDASGNVIITGWTVSQNFPVLNALQPTIASPLANDAFIAKLSASGVPIWCTYYGGSGGDNGYSVATDNSGSILFTGVTGSLDFPVHAAFQLYIGGQSDVFVVKLLADGSRCWATYYGGSSYEFGRFITADADDNVLITGTTSSENFPVENEWQTSHGGNWDAFIVKFNALGSRQWATYLGGDRYDEGLSIATDGSRNVLLTGSTYSLDFPVYNAWQSSLVGETQDVFIASLSPDGILMPLYMPATPTDLTVTALTPTKVQLTWTDNADNESEYVIEMQRESFEWVEAATDTANATQCTLTGLQSSTLYSFRVKAVNWAFSSAYSNIAQITMPEFKAPANLRVSDISSKEITC